MSVKIAINPITWTNDDVPELGGDTPLEQCLSEIRQAGYAGTELGGKYPRESAALKAVLAAHQLELAAGWWDGRLYERDVETEFEAILAHLTLLKDLGAKHAVYADTSMGRHDGIWQPISKRPRLRDEEWKGYGRKLTELAERMAQFGVGLAYHHHMGTVVETDEEVDRLMSVTGAPVGLLFDSGHSAFSGGDPVALCARHAERIVHVHCKDVRIGVLRQARERDLSFMDAVLEGIFTVPGDGGVDFPSILKSLADAGYSGWLVVEAEQDPKKAHPLTYAKMGHENLARMAAAGGLLLASTNKD
ncbi:myo-inosose-2 dehydratase [Mesorhizobium sp. WSM4307]|uniref:myo-inosose-2 dehydratase n=1 Tax=unclassified Mesorhizobium TaxID=325217 RepID=UPI000BAE7333|nr:MULTISPECIES: myo-inosose-2 dehydratase [unclassified Mesorhizobium]PBB24408.1 myo-inosose-2 dehydratase [Mesorhizobium sp. WSM4304]PBB74624.1 myo-inosose-2 dehydratase [Mesorhizobium sp. WSM4308]TRC73208.1 myo-inosose-2 dehydratase [Mesorhizobium sp. WSM4315]TRC83486.1 myo-inosose-2 dehydratase [Mesorhizobium sp. WSM4307]